MVFFYLEASGSGIAIYCPCKRARARLWSSERVPLGIARKIHAKRDRHDCNTHLRAIRVSPFWEIAYVAVVAYDLLHVRFPPKQSPLRENEWWTMASILDKRREPEPVLMSVDGIV